MAPLRIVIIILVLLALGLILGLSYYFFAIGSYTSSAAAKKRKKPSKLKAVVACAGPRSSARIHRYSGLADCRIVHSLFNGDRYCKDACIGYGTCRDLCPLGAIVLSPDGVPRISDDCDGCGLCVRECPSGALKLVPINADVYVRCVSRAEPSDRPSFCASSCNACGICERTTADAGFSVRTGIALIDYRAKGDRRPAVNACPSSCIAPLSAPESLKNAFQGENNGLEWSNRDNRATDTDK